MRGKLIVLEGTDGSGKATQAKLLLQSLEAQGFPCREIDFPRYGNPLPNLQIFTFTEPLAAKPATSTPMPPPPCLPWTALPLTKKSGAVFTNPAV